MKADYYFILGMPNCLQILLQNTSPISACLGTALLLPFIKFTYNVWSPPSRLRAQPLSRMCFMSLPRFIYANSSFLRINFSSLCAALKSSLSSSNTSLIASFRFSLASSMVLPCVIASGICSHCAKYVPFDCFIKIAVYSMRLKFETAKIAKLRLNHRR